MEVASTLISCHLANNFQILYAIYHWLLQIPNLEFKYVMQNVTNQQSTERTGLPCGNKTEINK